MPLPLSPEEIDRLARKRAGAKLGWYIHLVVYLLVNGLFFAATAMGLKQRPWTPMPAMGWGLGLVLHGVAVFVLGTGSSLREGMVRKERERLLRQQENDPH
jgi:hypothetical protein